MEEQPLPPYASNEDDYRNREPCPDSEEESPRPLPPKPYGTEMSADPVKPSTSEHEILPVRENNSTQDTQQAHSTLEIQNELGLPNRILDLSSKLDTLGIFGNLTDTNSASETDDARSVNQKRAFLRSVNDLLFGPFPSSPSPNMEERTGRLQRDSISHVLETLENITDEAVCLTDAADYWQKKEQDSAMRMEAAMKEMRERQFQLGKQHEESHKNGPREEQISSLLRHLESQNENLNRSLETVQSEHALGKRTQDSELLELQNENAALRQSVYDIDAGRDELERQLSEMSHSQSDMELRVRTDTAARITRDDRARQTRADQLHSALLSKENEVACLQQSLRDGLSDRAELERHFQIKTEELSRMSSDLEALVRQSQTVSLENTRLTDESSKLTGKIREERGRADRADHDLRATTMEKDDVLTNYRNVVGERSALESDLQTFQQTQTHQTQEITQLTDINTRLTSHLAHLRQDLDHHSGDQLSFQQKLEALSRQNLNQGRTLEATEEDNYRLREDLHACREACEEISHKMADMQRIVLKENHQSNSLREVVRNSEGERDALRRLLSQERQGVLDINDIVSKERAKRAAAVEEIRKLAKKNAVLTTQVNEFQVRFGNGEDIYTNAGLAVSIESPTALMPSVEREMPTTPKLSDYLNGDFVD